jgi:hypothetical protein
MLSLSRSAGNPRSDLEDVDDVEPVVIRVVMHAVANIEYETREFGAGYAGRAQEAELQRSGRSVPGCTHN